VPSPRVRIRRTKGPLLALHRTRDHARTVRLATEEDLDRLAPLLAELHKLPQLRARKRGYFSRGPHAFLHFHEDAGHFYVDVKLGSKFQRMRVTSQTEQAEFLSLVRLRRQEQRNWLKPRSNTLSAGSTDGARHVRLAPRVSSLGVSLRGAVGGAMIHIAMPVGEESVRLPPRPSPGRKASP